MLKRWPMSNFRHIFDSNKNLLKKKKKNVSIIEKCVAPSCGTFFNQKKMVKKGNVEIRVWVWLEIVLKCRGRI